MRRTRSVAALVGAALLALGVGASGARPAGSDQVTISMLFNVGYQPGWSVLIANFERAYPNITVNATYEPTAAVRQDEPLELAAGNAPDLLYVTPGCGGPTSVCALAQAGDLAPMIDKPWAKRSLPLITSLDKYHQGLFAFEPVVTPHGIFTDDGLFAKLGLKVPQTFSQLIAVCKKAQADGTWAIDLPGASPITVEDTILGLVTPLVFRRGTYWTAALKAGTVSFERTAGWRQALQEFADMNTAGCFEPGMTGNNGEGLFPHGQGLMFVSVSADKGQIDGALPQFSYTFHPFPATTAPGQPRTFLHPGPAVGVNARSSAQNQAAAQAFIDFVARPKENALYARVSGGLTQDEFLKGQLPAFMSDFGTIFNDREYVLEPLLDLGNANVAAVFAQDGIGLITGQETPDSMLQAMDAAWKSGP